MKKSWIRSSGMVGHLWYLVKFVGFPNSENEWIPHNELEHAPEAIQDFHHLHPSAPHHSSPGPSIPKPASRQSSLKRGDVRACPLFSSIFFSIFFFTFPCSISLLSLSHHGIHALLSISSSYFIPMLSCKLKLTNQDLPVSLTSVFLKRCTLCKEKE